MSSSLEKFLYKIITVQFFVNLALHRIIDTLIYKMFLPYAANLVDLDYFQYSRELIISFVVILVAYFFYN
jgi:hypothetical protein